MTSRAARVLGWLLLAALVFVTLAPLGYRPVSGLPPTLERFAAFALLGFVFTLGYPGRRWQVLALTVTAAIGLEALQVLAPSRHGRMADLVVKLGGCGFGAAASLVLSILPSPRQS